MGHTMGRPGRSTLLLLVAALLLGATGVAAAAVHARRQAPSDVAAAGARLGAAIHFDAPPELPAATGKGLEKLQQLAVDPATQLLGIATFDGLTAPNANLLAGLRGLGITAQPLQSLPMAYVLGTRAQLEAAVTSGAARDVYPNERLQHYGRTGISSASVPTSTDSTGATGALDVHQLGITGAGVGIAIVDSGIDATHPALADHVTHNVKVISPEYLNLVGVPTGPDTPPGMLVVPVDQGPYNNSDTESGHGTHCAGIAAADGTGNADLVGMAPDADLIGISTGEVLFITNAVGGLDVALTHHIDWNIDVVSNSWGSAFAQFDPGNPVNIATKALHDAGVMVVFAAGNDGEDMTINPYSVAPWVVSVAAATDAKQKADFTSGGLEFDDSTAAAVPPDKHLHFTGNRIGIYHPDVSAPGVDVLSTGTPTGTIVGPSEPGGTAVASGTSMATPHVAGLAALLLQANPSLTPDQVALVLATSADRMPDDTPFWRGGYGFINAPVAVASAQSFNPSSLTAQRVLRDRVVLGDRDYRVFSEDLWAFDALPVTVGGLDSRTFSVDVPSTTQAVQGQVAFPSTAVLGINQFDYSITLRDAAGTLIGESPPASASAGHSNVFVDLRQLTTAPVYGTWTVEVAGLLGASDPDVLLGKRVTAAFTQLQTQTRQGAGGSGPVFSPVAALPLFFAGSGDPGRLSTQEGCAFDSGVTPAGALATGAPEGAACRAGLVGFATSIQAAKPALFTSAPLGQDTVVGGTATVSAALVDALQPVWSAAFASKALITVDAVGPDGKVIALGSSESLTVVGPTATRSLYDVDIVPTGVPAGSTLRLQLSFSGVYTSTMYLLYGGGAYATDGITLTVGTLA